MRDQQLLQPAVLAVAGQKQMKADGWMLLIVRR